MLSALFIFVVFGVLANWVVASFFFIIFTFLTFIIYLILNGLDKHKLNKLRRKYNEKEDESRPIDFKGGFERTTERTTDTSIANLPAIEGPDRNKLHDVSGSGNTETGDGETERRDKPNRFTPI